MDQNYDNTISRRVNITKTFHILVIIIARKIKRMSKKVSGGNFNHDENDRLKSLVAEHSGELEQKEMIRLLDELKAENELLRKTGTTLPESERLFSELFHKSPVANIITTPYEGTIVDVNQAFEQIMEYTHNEAIEKTTIEVGLFEDLQDRNTLVDILKEKGTVSGYECGFRTKTGKLYYGLISIVFIQIKDKTYQHSTIIDITRRKLAEEALRKSETRLKRAELASKIGNWELHLDSGMIIGSGGAAKIYGGDLEQMEYDIIKKIPLPEYRPLLDRALKQLVEDDILYDLEFKIKAVDTGEIKDIHSQAFYDKEKRVVFGIIQDITERKRNEETLKRSEEKYRTLIELAPDGFFQGDIKGNFITVNDKACLLTGFSREELLSMNMAELFSETALNEKPLRYDLLRSGDTIKTERRIRRKSGELIDIEMNSKAMPDGTYQSFLHDITSRKKEEEVLRESENRLRELNLTKDRFFSIIGHDLKSPFNSIVGFSNLLVEKIQDKDYEGIEQYAEIIQNSSQLAMNLLQNLLEWSRAQTGRIEYSPEYLEMVSLVNEIAEFLSDSARQKSISMFRELPRNVVAFADKAMISTVLRNLVSNAIKFTHPGGQIVISAEQRPEGMFFSVSDSGIGIKKESLEKLFRIEESYSTPGTQNEKGTGLGLILCKEFVEKHGGKIWAESKVGKGSTFCFTIPGI